MAAEFWQQRGGGVDSMMKICHYKKKEKRMKGDGRD